MIVQGLQLRNSLNSLRKISLHCSSLKTGNEKSLFLMSLEIYT
jgi:hypothetical protein